MVPWHLQPKYRADMDKESKEHRSKPKKQRTGKKKPKRQDRKQNRAAERTEENHEKELGEPCGELEDTFLCFSLDEVDHSVDAELSLLDKETVGYDKEGVHYGGKDHSCHHSGASQQVGYKENQRDHYQGEPVGKTESQEPSTSQRSGTLADPITAKPPGEEGVTEVEHLGDQGGSTYQRYYHVFREHELSALVHRVEHLKVEEEYYDHENWCVIAVKTTSL